MTSNCDANSFEISGSGKSLKKAFSVLLIHDSNNPRVVMSRVGSAAITHQGVWLRGCGSPWSYFS